ncbi:preprotein translocase subunit SecE [Wenyingzhuangia aestuarii]|uniref:preprotein translocase subunit SecE n=1 Tax=Wenyingzhuangia aestuarii TaxID=1647582 RepID=UPI001438B0CD|nr:preprotein translocase subunit SecE [Wenyingzhuangia aestuarii]NJB82508.1 preprotein translocase subunit SecE [Wenyingzhuangia aestuarii]
MNIINYIKSSFIELKDEMTWVSKEEAQKSTVVVAIFTIIFALTVFVVDQFFQTGLEWFFNILK